LGKLNDKFNRLIFLLILYRNTNPNVYRIIFGLHDRLISDSWVITRTVASVVVYPQYSSRNFVNDIALMKLSVRILSY
jgi:multisubunit Na+/H+ antiporter MnhF subunit